MKEKGRRREKGRGRNTDQELENKGKKHVFNNSKMPNGEPAKTRKTQLLASCPRHSFATGGTLSWHTHTHTQHPENANTLMDFD